MTLPKTASGRHLGSVGDAQWTPGLALVVVEAEIAGDVQLAVIAGGQQSLPQRGRRGPERDGLEPSAIRRRQLEPHMAGRR